MNENDRHQQLRSWGEFKRPTRPPIRFPPDYDPDAWEEIPRPFGRDISISPEGEPHTEDDDRGI